MPTKSKSSLLLGYFTLKNTHLKLKCSLSLPIHWILCRKMTACKLSTGTVTHIELRPLLFLQLNESYFRTETRKQIQCVLLQMVVICTQCLLSFLPCEPSPLTSDQEEVRLQGKPKYPVSKHEGWALPFQATHTPECTTQILVQMGHALTCKVKHTN